MRIRIAREGVETKDGRLIDESALFMETAPSLSPVALMMAPDPGDQRTNHDGAVVIGTADALQREAEGWVTAEVQTPVDLTGYAAEVDIDNMGRVRAVVMGRRPCWDGMVIESWPTP